jgi:hypothetical protein
VIVVRFGKSGRLARICEAALRIAHPQSPVVSASRDRAFTSDADGAQWHDIKSTLRERSVERVLLIDASVDHTSSTALIEHEEFKRETIRQLKEANVLLMAIGFSSGIATVDPMRIRPTATHMHEYRRQKLMQEELFLTLNCPCYLPQLFTLIGPLTYAGQNAAWARILKARLEREPEIVLDEPLAVKAWVSEYTVLRTLIDFLSSYSPPSFTGPLVAGSFTLAGLASEELLSIPPLHFSKGDGLGWLIGDYTPPTQARQEALGLSIHTAHSVPINEELLRAVSL